MAFNNLKEFGIDKSDMSIWAGTPEALAFNKDLIDMKEQAFRKLLKDGEKCHSQNAEKYKAYESILKLFEEARNL